MQALRSAHRTTIQARAPLSRALNSNISGGSMGKAWADKEHAVENQYFNKRDVEVLAQLAAKLKNHTAPTQESMAMEREALSAIFAKHSTTPSEALLDELVKFKFSTHH